MELDPESLVTMIGLLLGVGCVAGLLAGLLGVGGGIVVVPGMFYVLGALGVDSDIRMHVAVGTSLATIIPTAMSSIRAHHKRKAVDTQLLKSWGPSVVVGVMAGTFLALAAIITFLSKWHGHAHATIHQQLSDFIHHDASPSFTTDEQGEIRSQNLAAVERFGTRGGQTLKRAFRELFADPGGVLYRLQNHAAGFGTAREDVVTRRGHVRLSVNRIGEAGFLWRLEDMAERAVAGRSGENISLPMMTVSKSGTILFMGRVMDPTKE